MAATSYVARWVGWTHPRRGRPVAQAWLLLLALCLGGLLGLGLLTADRASWSGARVLAATVTGRSAKGVLADAEGRTVVLHLTAVPRPGTVLRVEVSPDGRARPLSYRQTAARALRSGLLLAVGLAALAQTYRWFVTGRTTTNG